MNPIKPFHNNVLCKQHEDEGEKMYGSIILSDTGKEKPIIARVLDVGMGTYILGTDTPAPMQAVKGKLILIPSFGGQRVTYDGEEYIIIKDQDILGEINEQNNIGGTGSKE